MIYEKFEYLFNRLISETDDDKLHWMRFEYFKSKYMSSMNMLEIPLLAHIFNMENICWGGKISYETSFFAKKNDDFLLLIDFFPPCSPKDGTAPEKERVLQLIGGSLMSQDEVIVFPDYTTDNFHTLLDSIIKYRKRLGLSEACNENSITNSMDFIYGFIS